LLGDGRALVWDALLTGWEVTLNWSTGECYSPVLFITLSSPEIPQQMVCFSDTGCLCEFIHDTGAHFNPEAAWHREEGVLCPMNQSQRGEYILPTVKCTFSQSLVLNALCEGTLAPKELSLRGVLFTTKQSDLSLGWSWMGQISSQIDCFASLEMTVLF
jgi:hypothetical protein